MLATRNYLNISLNANWWRWQNMPRLSFAM